MGPIKSPFEQYLLISVDFEAGWMCLVKFGCIDLGQFMTDWFEKIERASKENTSPTVRFNGRLKSAPYWSNEDIKVSYTKIGWKLCEKQIFFWLFVKFNYLYLQPETDLNGLLHEVVAGTKY